TQMFSYTYGKYIFGQIGSYEDDATFRLLYEASRKYERVSPFLLQEAERLFSRMVEQFDTVTNALAKNAMNHFPRKRDHKQTVFLSQLTIYILQKHGLYLL
uniref:hypothetical protein n=1 Tax=Staphylococcus haemolyticus TaxID=1283 RepID=UPI0015D7A4F1